MKLKMNYLFYVGFAAWVLTFYFLITGEHDWKLWVTVSIAFLERILFQLSILLLKFIARKYFDSMIKATMEDKLDGTE